MITIAIITSIQILAIYVAFKQGSIFGFIADYLLKITPLKFHHIYKPLFDCYVCMGGIYTIAKGLILGFDMFFIIQLMLLVIGINYIINSILERLE